MTRDYPVRLIGQAVALYMSGLNCSQVARVLHPTPSIEWVRRHVTAAGMFRDRQYRTERRYKLVRVGDRWCASWKRYDGYGETREVAMANLATVLEWELRGDVVATAADTL